MEREFVDLFESAKKAADLANIKGILASGPEVSRCVDALKQLKNFPVTYDVLASAKVGKQLQYLSEHRNQKIRSTASSLIETWKQRSIKDETGKVKRKGSSSITNFKTRKSNSMNWEVKKQTTVAFFSSMKPSQATIASSQKKKSSDNASREKVREILLEGLSKVVNEIGEDMRDEVFACDPSKVAAAVESVMFVKLGPFDGEKKLINPQKKMYRTVMFNLKDPKNPDFRRKVLLGQISPEILVDMNTEEMASNRRQYEIKELKNRSLS